MKFNNAFAVLLVLLIAFLWVIRKWAEIPDSVMGVLTTVFILVVQFFYRKAPPDAGAK